MAVRLLFILYSFNKVEQKILPWAWLSYGVYLLRGKKASFLSPVIKLGLSYKCDREGKMPVSYLRQQCIKCDHDKRQNFLLIFIKNGHCRTKLI
jgi:hypothetical protein